MNAVAHAGSSIVIKGEVVAKEDFTVAGRIEGTLSAEGFQVLVLPGAHVEADVIARDIVIAGAVKGTLIADERIELRNGADIEGHLTTPRIAMIEGAIVQGIVEMPAAKPRLAVAS